MLDIAVRMRTTHIHPQSGEEVTDPYVNAQEYLLSVTFFIDLLSSIPWSVVTPGIDAFRYLGLLKILRVLRIATVISNLNQSQEFKSLAKMVFLMFIMLIYINFMGCIWNIVVELEEEWIPNKDFLWNYTPQMYEYYYMDWSQRFFVSLYIGYYLFGVGEVCPRTTYEFAAAIPILILSSIVNGLIIGNMAVYLAEFSKTKAEFQSKMDTVNTAMK